LLDELRRLPERELRTLARRILATPGDPEMELAKTQTALASALSDPATLARILTGLDDEAREALAWLRLAGGALTASDLEALAGRSEKPLSALRYALATLERHGLVFPGASLERGVVGWRIAPETRATLPRALPIASLSRADLAAERPRVERASPRALMLALALLPHAPAPLGMSSRPERAERSSSLTEDDLPEVALLTAARGAGLEPDAARLARQLLRWSLGEAADDAARSALLTTGSEAAPELLLRGFQAAFARWRDARSPADLMDLGRSTGTVRLRYDHTHEALSPAALADEAAIARRWVTRLLGLMEVAAWYRLDELIELIWRVNPFFLRGKQLAWRTPVWRLERVADGRPLLPTVRAEWLAAEGAYLRAMLTGPLRLWGALDLALNSDQTLRLFRLTPLGAALLGHAVTAMQEAAARALGFDWGPAATLTKEGALAVQPLAASSELLVTLGEWAEITGLAGGRLLYTFTPSRALARFDEGLTMERALGPLRSAGLTRAAQALAPKLEGWRQGYGDARLTSGLVIVEGRDEATLREAMAALPDLAKRARAIGPAVVALAPADAAALRVALTRKGWEL
jgi:hypothetical protein